MAQVAQRHALGHFTPAEAAQALADAHGVDAVELINQMRGAHLDGDLTTRSPRTRMPRRKGDRFLPTTDHVLLQDVDVMLERLGVDYRFPQQTKLPTKQTATGFGSGSNASHDPAEMPEARRSRRLARFTELLGEIRRAGDAWQLCGRRGALADLVREEAAAGRQRAKRQDVTRDLHAAMAEQMQS
jgi:hypothetical protein